jgi:protoheme IX farnesyltransferase
VKSSPVTVENISAQDEVVVPERASRAALLRDYLVLTKPRITLMVVLTAMGGYWAAARDWGDPVVLVAMLLGTSLTAAGASAVNMVLEMRTDALMQRTRNRPLPAGRLRRADAVVFAWSVSLLGLFILALFCGLWATLTAAVTWASYLYIYTPLKPRSSISTLVGAVPGALPPLIGWAAARQQLDWLGWVLFAIIFLWQLPHFLAIAVIYREDYKRGGFPMLPVIDGTGSDEPGGGLATVRQMLISTLALIPVSLAPVLHHAAGPLYVWGALLAGLLLLAAVLRYAFTRTTGAARGVFYTSLLYLPAVFGLLMADGRTPMHFF